MAEFSSIVKQRNERFMYSKVKLSWMTNVEFAITSARHNVYIFYYLIRKINIYIDL